MVYDVSIIGVGFVGGACLNSFKDKGLNVFCHDKYKNEVNMGDIDNCLNTEMIFLCLPTIFDKTEYMYNKSAIYDVCNFLNEKKYNGIVILKSTVEPQTTNDLCSKYPNLQFIHNPEFLTARTAYNDFHNQTHIVLGKSNNCTDNNLSKVNNFFSLYYPSAEITKCTSDESETMKICVNSFYSVKIQFFNELYLLCEKMNVSYDNVKDIMLKNKWFTPHHTNVPGPDGKLSYGGACFPKDTSALLEFMKRLDTPHMVLESVVNERNSMRDDE